MSDDIKNNLGASGNPADDEIKSLVDELERVYILPRSGLKKLLTQSGDYLFQRARAAANKAYGNKIFVRGLIEFTNYCKNDCFYCGLRRGNSSAQRYRLSTQQILECCKSGYELGFRTFVLQGGEDGFFSDSVLVKIIQSIKEKYPDCALTLSIGERSFESYKKLFDAGADRYLLRHETADSAHYAQLHPVEMSLARRKQCLFDLKKIGFQVGTGFMVGSPHQTHDNIIDDLLFIKELSPAMVGVGVFLPHSATPFGGQKAGSLPLTLNILAILRLMKPNLLIPATTALGTVDSRGREMGMLAGANVIMPNLSPPAEKKKYLLYDNKIDITDEAAQSFARIKQKLNNLGFETVSSRGDYNGK